MKTESSYLKVVFLIERLHRLFLENIKAELDDARIYDINNTQALILYNIGKDQVPVGELTQRGYYLGSNVSYNLRKMVENDFLIQETSPHDKRSTIVKLSSKGLELYEFMSRIMEKHVDALNKEGIVDKLLGDTVCQLKSLEKLWIQGKGNLSFK
jgi:DNA-binding MarR family transcriptional regulator